MANYNVLLYRFPEQFMKVRLGLLARPPFVTEAATRPGEFFHRLEMTHYRMLVLHLPDEVMQFTQLLPLIRGEGRPSARCILIVLSSPRHLDEFRPFLGKGVNVLLSLEAPAADLEAAIARQVEVAPRVEARVIARIQAHLTVGAAKLLCRTANLSTSGMFLDLNRKLPLGSVFAFDLAIPGVKEPVSGTGTIVRYSDPEREGHDGMGASFSSFRPGCEAALRQFIAQRAQS